MANVTLGEPRFIKPEVKKISKITKVKQIVRLTTLDQGSQNDKSGTFQPGMIFGKTYSFKVKSYTKETPNDKSVIKWMLKYHSLSENKWITRLLPAKGETANITMDEKESCGRFVYIRAYIDDAETEGELKVWKHNRFRWFDRMIVEQEIKDRTDNKKSWLVDQAGTSLCGMACIFYLFAKEQPNEYKRFAKQLFRTGEANHNSYVVKPSIEVLEKKMNINKKAENTGGMPLVDYITMAGTRNTHNPDYKGGDEEFQAINWPPLMTKLSEEFLGYKNVVSKGVYNPIKPLAYTSHDVKVKIDDINKQFNNAYKLIFMIDADLIDDQWDVSSLDLHWIVLESPIVWNYIPSFFGAEKDEIDFKVYTWGTDPNGANRYLKKTITSSHFMNNYNGYIKVK